MQKDNVGKFCLSIIPNIQLLVDEARKKGLLVVYACDTRFSDDSIFKKLQMPVHTVKGTEGWKVVDELSPNEKDIIIEKPRMSAFFGTSLDFLLREKNIKTLIVCGIRTEICLFKTVLDAFELGYEVIVPVDCCASPSPETHEAILKVLDILKVKKPKVKDLIKTL